MLLHCSAHFHPFEPKMRRLRSSSKVEVTEVKFSLTFTRDLELNLRILTGEKVRKL